MTFLQIVAFVGVAWLAIAALLTVGMRRIASARPRLLAPAHADPISGLVDGCASWRFASTEHAVA